MKRGHRRFEKFSNSVTAGETRAVRDPFVPEREPVPTSPLNWGFYCLRSGCGSICVLFLRKLHDNDIMRSMAKMSTRNLPYYRIPFLL